MQLPHILVFLTALFLAASGKPPAGDTWMVLSPRARFARVTWIPTAEQVLKARRAAKRHLKETLPGLGASKDRHDQWLSSNVHVILELFDFYRLQACGRTRDGRRLIYLNFVMTFGPESEQRWRNDELYMILDGGFCFWTATYDPESDTILRWGVS